MCKVTVFREHYKCYTGTIPFCANTVGSHIVVHIVDSVLGLEIDNVIRWGK